MKHTLIFAGCLVISLCFHAVLFWLPFDYQTADLEASEQPEINLHFVLHDPPPPPESEPEPEEELEREVIIEVAEAELEVAPEPDPEREEVEGVPEDIVISQEAIEEAEGNYWTDVRKKIAVNLRYPVSARRRGRGARVTVGIEIGVCGQLIAVEVMPPRASRDITRAVLHAVRKASPFAAPPPTLDPPVRAELTICFEVQR